jgi:ferritin-like metal-binding protein YciE
MKTNGKPIYGLRDLFLVQLRDIRNAEHRLSEGLERLNEQSFHFELKEALEHHRRQTTQHLARLDTVFHTLDEPVGGEESQPMRSLLDQAFQTMSRCQTAEVTDAALVTAIQHINHYEIATYGTIVAFAQSLDLHTVAAHLLDTLRDEKETDRRLSQLAVGYINEEAK